MIDVQEQTLSLYLGPVLVDRQGYRGVEGSGQA